MTVGSIRELGERLAAKSGAFPDDCGVVGCDEGDADLVELKPLDPIDHDSTLIQLCPTHTVWAEERNELAESVADRLREKRKEIGKERMEDIQRLARPQDGRLSEEYLMGEKPAVPVQVGVDD